MNIERHVLSCLSKARSRQITVVSCTVARLGSPPCQHLRVLKHAPWQLPTQGISSARTSVCQWTRDLSVLRSHGYAGTTHVVAVGMKRASTTATRCVQRASRPAWSPRQYLTQWPPKCSSADSISVVSKASKMMVKHYASSTYTS